MSIRKLLLSSAVVLAFNAHAAADEINIGVPNWAAAQVITDIMSKVLTEELGVTVNLVPGTNPVIFEAMDTGDLDVHPDVWLPNQKNLVQTYVEERGSVMLSNNPYGGGRALCVTKQTVEKTGIKDIYDLTDPDIARQFDTNGDGKGEIWVGAAGWASTTIEKVRMHSYGIAETFELLEMDEEAGMARIRAAQVSGEPFATNCVRPNAMYMIADLVPLEEPAYDEAKWQMISPTEDPDWLTKSNVEVGWPAINVHVAYAKRLESEHPDAAAIFSRMGFETEMIDEFIFQVMEQKQEPQAVADAWLEANQDRVRTWLGY